MLTTFSGRIASIGEGKYTTEGTPVIDFQLAVDRGNVKKRVSLLTGKEYDADFYKVSLFGQTALSFAQYAQVGRNVDVSGRLLQEEYLSKNQTIQIATDNPLYGYFRQLVGQVPQDQLNYDNAGNLYIKGNHAVNRASITGLECRWRDKNPNAQASGGFQPQANGFVSQGFGGATAPTGGFGTTPAPTGFGGGFGGSAPATAPATGGFGVQPQPQATGGFGVQPQMPVPQQTPVMPQTFGGFPTGQVANMPGFGVQPQNGVVAGFTGQENPTGSAGLPGFGAVSTQPQGFVANQGFVPPVDGGNAQGFTAPTNDGTVVNNAVTNNTNAGNVETNIPAPENNASAESSVEKKDGETVNQGF